MATGKKQRDRIAEVVSSLRLRKGLLIVVSAPSGAGKTTICEKLLGKMPELEMSVSFTTRRPRKGERDGKDYYFVSRKKFREELAAGRFLEWAEVHDHFYGTPRDFLDARVEAGKDTVLDVDVQGAYKISRSYREAVLILLLPPSMAELKSRLEGRGSDKAAQIKRRLKKAELEFSCYPRFDYLVVNEDVEEAVKDLEAIIKAERRRAKRLSR